jgi:hypothetical protein
MDKVIEALKNSGATPFILKMLVEIVIMYGLLYSSLQVLTARFDIYEKQEMDIAGRVLTLEKKEAFDDGKVYGMLDTMSKQMEKFEIRLGAIEQKIHK